MAASSPENVSKKRKDSISHLKRDQPLFASRRIAPLQQAPDFFTESLNTSYVASPSPARSPPKRPHGRPKTRNTSGGRNLAATFKATAKDEENRRPTSSPSSDPYYEEYGLKPRPGQTDTRPRSSPSNGSNGRAKTPSPVRGRHHSITSPASSQHSQSSPPRGLAEAYQRIVDEETLAQEESIDNSMDAYGYDYGEDTDMSGLTGAHDPISPTSLKASRRASRESTPVVASENKENTQGSGSGSQRSSLDNITDRSLDSAISQYSKDAQRLNGALRSNVKIFSKARVGERVGLTMENLQRRNGSSDSLGSAFGGSLSSKGSDPSLNLPKAWGRKAKPPKDWLSRINSKSGRLTGDVPKKQKADSPIIAESERREWDEPIDSWIHAADVPLPSEDNGSLQAYRSSSTSTPTAAQNGLRDGASGWDVDADFTGRSLQVSDSPPIRIRDTTQDLIRNPEIDKLEKRALTTSRLGEIREKDSRDRLRHDSSAFEGKATPQRPSSSRSSLGSRRKSKDSDNVSNNVFEGDGESIPDTPVIIYKSSSESSNGRKSTRSKDKSPAQRPQHDRHDSRDILQRLARATSASPATSQDDAKETASSYAEAKSQNVAFDTNENDQISERPKREPDLKRDSSTNGQKSKLSKPVNETPASSKSSTRLKTPHVTGAWTDNTISEDTPGPSISNANLKTPMVMGAWVDTPLPPGGRGPPMPTPNIENDAGFILEGNEARKLATSDLVKKLSPSQTNSLPALRNTSRPLPKSALESVLNAAKASLASGGGSPHFAHSSDSDEESPLHLGDSTIQSLEDIIHDNTSFSSPPSPPATDDAPEDEELSPSTELKPYARQLSRLNSLLPSIRDARKNIAQLERAVSSTRTLAPRPPQGECTEGGEFHDFIWPCERCGCSAAGRSSPMPALFTFISTDDLTTLQIPIPRLWRWREEDWRPRLTWLGLFLLLASAWWFLEGIMCELYCHPRYASSMTGYGVDINSPEPPFVLEQMLWRWLSPEHIIRPFYILLRAFVRLCAQGVGYIAGLWAGDGGGGTVRQPVSTDPKLEYAPDSSMFDDEFL